MNFSKKQYEFVLSGKTQTFDFRKKNLLKLKSLIQKHEIEIFEALKKDLGKDSYESFLTEVGFLYQDINHTVKHLKSWMSPKKVKTPITLFPASSEIHHEPFGRVLIIAPWNYPFQLCISPLVGAMAAGNVVVLKPSEVSTHTESLIQKIISENFLPEYIHVVTGGVEETQKLLKEKFDFIFFTGSTQVGQVVMKAAAEHLTPVCLELGGKSPCIVDQHTDLKVTCKRIAWAKFINAGQTCVAPDFVYVHESIKPQFVKELKKSILNLYGENTQENPIYCKIINEQHLMRLKNLLEPKNIILGGNINRDICHMEPTLMDNVQWGDRVMEEEIFGPILPILSFSNLEAVIEKLQKQPKPLALYLFSKDKRNQSKVLNNLSFGGGCINDAIMHLANPNLPFGGVGNSGIGAYHGLSSFEVFTHKKSILKNKFSMDNGLKYPPYTNGKMSLLRKLFK